MIMISFMGKEINCWFEVLKKKRNDCCKLQLQEKEKEREEGLAYNLSGAAKFFYYLKRWQ